MMFNGIALLAFNIVAVQSMVFHTTTNEQHLTAAKQIDTSLILQQQTQELRRISQSINELNPNNNKMIVGKPLSVSGLLSDNQNVADMITENLNGLTIKVESNEQKPFLLRFSKKGNNATLVISEFKD